MSVFNRLTGIVLCCCLLAFQSGCGSSVARPPVGDRTHRQAWTPDTHKVRPSDTLYSIAWEYSKEVHDLARWNDLRPPYRIVIGQRIRLKPPRHSKRSSKTVITNTKPSTPSVSKSAKPAVKPPSPSTPKGPYKAVTTGPVKWQWPVQGKILRRFQANSLGKKGIAIAGKPGHGVRAAAPGRVVYSGSGLVGYGRLIIIKHNNNYLSAYGHNRKLFAKEGSQVQGGQLIAEMGSSGTDRTQLHFEIRKKGKPVDPLRYLPRR